MAGSRFVAPLHLHRFSAPCGQFRSGYLKYNLRQWQHSDMEDVQLPARQLELREFIRLPGVVADFLYSQSRCIWGAGGCDR